MSIFDAGFIMWGYFALYALIIVAYYVWMVRRGRRDDPERPARRDSPGRSRPVHEREENR